MQRDKVQILRAKFGKNIEIDYYDRTDGRNHSIEDNEAGHKDLKDALMAFKAEVGDAYYSVGGTLRDYITPNEVIVTEKGGEFFLTVKGKFATSHGDEVNISSGLIKMPDEVDDDLVIKLNTLRGELWEYFWNDKADGKLPFNKGSEEGNQVKEELETVSKN